MLPPSRIDDEPQFRTWYAGMAKQYALNPDPDSQPYDYRSAYRAGAKPDASGHWPSQFKKAGHPNEIVGGFNTRTGERVPGTPRAKDAAALVALGWDTETAEKLAATPEPRDPASALSKATKIGPAPQRTVLDRAESAVRAPAAGVVRVFTKPFWGALEAASDALGLESVAEWSRAAGQQADELVETVRGSRAGAGPTEQAVYEGLESVGVTAPALAAGAMTGSPNVALGIMGAATAGESYQEARKKDVPPLQALGYSAVQGVTEVLTEKIPASRLLGDLAKRTGVVKTILRQAAVEIPGEQVATIVQDMNDWVTLNPEKTLAEYVAERPSQAARTLVATLVGTVVQAGGAVALDRAATAISGRRAEATPAETTPAPAATFAEFASQRTEAPAAEPPATVDAAATAPVVPPPVAGDLTQEQRNALAREEAAAAPPAKYDAEAIAAGRALERRVAQGQSPTGEERRVHTAAPVEREAYLNRKEYDAGLRATYFDGEERKASSREVPQTAPIPPVGTWMIDDSFKAADGHEIEQLVEVPVENIEISEDTGAERFGDVERYARWTLEGKEAPPIRVTQTDRGTLKTMDHRRLLAAKAAGQPTVKAWVSWSTQSDREGNPVAGLTYELAQKGAQPLPIQPARLEHTIFKDDAKRLEEVRTRLTEERPKRPFAEVVAEMKATRQRHVDAVVSTFNAEGAVRTVSKNGVVHLTTASARNPGVIQVTSMDGDTPTGHVEFPSIVEAAAYTLGDQLDTPVAQAQTTHRGPESEESLGAGATGRPSLDRIAASQPVGLESHAQREARRASHYKQVFAHVLANAQADDPLVDRKALKAEFDARVSFIDDLDAEFRDSGHNPRELLEAIRGNGGISQDAEHLGGLSGEIAWLRESAAGPYGNFAGVPNVFRQRQSGDVAGRRRTGLSLDEMATHLQQDPRFAHITGPNELLEALEDVARMGDVGTRGAVYPGTAELAERAGMRAGTPWWKDSWRAEAQPTEPEPLTAESYQRASGVTREQAEATVAVFDAMGVRDRALVAKGGEAGGPRGSVEFTEHGHAIIRLLQNPNVSTGVHEAWHVGRRFLFDRAIPQDLREGITDDDILMAEEAFGVKDGVWDRDAEERWARAGERYLYDGQAPSEGLQALFDKFARWLAKIYKNIAGSPIDIEISPAMRQVFDRLITRSERLDEAVSFNVEDLERELAGGEETLYQDDRPGRAKRGRPKNMVSFSPAISGPSGAKLYGYQWHWTTDLVEDKREGMVERRVSDWENAVPNETTGRDIVHEFLLERKDGTVSSVSLETALRELGYLAQAEGSKQVRGIASTLKTLARARMDRDRLLPLKERHEADLARARREVDGLTVPEPVITREVLDQGGTVRFRVTVGDEYQMRFNRAATVDDYRRTPDAKEHIADVVADWQGARVQERRTVPWSSKERFALEAAEESIRKAEQRLAKAGVNLTEAPGAVDTLDTGEEQPRLPGAEDVREQDIKTPEFEAPFALTGEVSKAKKGKQETLFQSDDKGKRITLDELARVAQRRRLPLERVRQVAAQAGYVVADDGPRPVRVETGRDIPPQKPIPEDRLHEFPSIQKMPVAIRADIEDMLQRYHGFEAQRRGVQSWDRTQEMAKDVWLPLETLRPGKALNAEELSAYQTAIATALTMRKPLLEKVKDGTATDWDRLQVSHLTDVATVLTASYRGAKAEAGRALNILRAKARVLDLHESRFLEAAMKAPGFDGDLTKLSKEALGAAGDPLKQLQLLRQRSGTKYDLFLAYYYGNLLSGIKTQERNLIGNSFNAVVNLATPLGAVPMDVLRSARTGQPRTVFLGEIPEAIRGSLIGMESGIRNAAFTFVQGFRPRTIEAARLGVFDTPRKELPGGVWNPWNVPGRALEAVDEFFRAIAHHQELYAGLYAQARQEGLTTGKAIGDRMAELMTATDRTTEDGKLAEAILERVVAFEDRAVFQEPAGHVVNTLMKLKAPTAPMPVRLAATFIMPFMRISGAITRQGFEYTPAGFAMRGARGDLGKGRVQSQAEGRALLGSLALLPMAWLAVTGRLTGAPPDDPGDREEFYAQGKLANAVKIGNYWVRYVLFQPFSVPLAAVANAWNTFKDSEQDEGAAQEAMAAAVAGAGASVLDQSFLAGVGSMMDAVNDPGRYAGQWLSLFAQGFVPLSGLARNVTQAVDPVYRKPEGVVESVKAIIPGQSDTLPPRRTRMGEPATRPGNWVQRGFVVPEVSKEIDDAVTTTLARLKVQPITPQPDLTLRGQTVKLAREQEDVLIEALGRERKLALEDAIRRPGFSSRPDEVQREILERAMAVAGRSVRERALRAVARKDPFTVDRLVSRRVLEQQRQAQEALFGQPQEADAAVAR